MQQELLNRTFMVMRRKKKIQWEIISIASIFFFDRAQLKIDVPVNSLSIETSLKNIQNLIYESALPKISFQSERENVMIGGDKHLIISSQIIYYNT